MKTYLIAICLLVIPSLTYAKTIKYTYNSGGGCTSRKVSSTPQPDTRPAVYPSLDPKDLEIKIASDFISINIASEKMDINVGYIITNALGQTVSSGILTETTNTIDVSELPSGIYIISLSSEDEPHSLKFIKS